jgi:transcriptional regulator with XRE-family HTH domain
MAQTRLKQLREEAVLTVHELAEASGVSDDTISKIENGQRVARPNTLRKLARTLDVSPQELRRPAKVEEPALPLGKAPREAGPAPNSLEELLERRGASTQHLADENLKEKLDKLPLEDHERVVREVSAEILAIAPDLGRLRHSHGPLYMRLHSEVSRQYLIASWSLRARLGQEFVPVETKQKLDEAGLALAEAA